MKHILITGKNSYLGTAVESRLKQYPSEYQVNTIDLHGDQWKMEDFSLYDSIFHVAGLAHADVGKISDKVKANYYKINRDLTIAVAQKAKDEGVKQFVFMSSIIIYGDCISVGPKRVIKRETVPTPSNFYGDSKLQAEIGLRRLEDETFRVAIVRPPMIYGKGCKGNYPTLAKLACRMPIFPDIDNERSMLFVDNFCEFIEIVINYQLHGLYFPQNKEYVRTSDMIRLIAENHNKKIVLTKSLNWFIKIAEHVPGKISRLSNKAFGNLVYDQKISSMPLGIRDYRIIGLSDSIRMIEGKE